jgi:hypothetical protein
MSTSAARKCSVLCASIAAFGLLAPPAGPQVAPSATIEEEVVAFAIAADGRIAYAVRRTLSQRFLRERIDIQRDDFWMRLPGGARKRIVNGEKLVKSSAPFSYAVRSIRFSPDGTKLIAELDTSVITDEKFNRQDDTVTLLLDQTGKEINIAGAQSIIPGGVNGAWLPDGVSVGYLSEAVKPRLLSEVNSLRPAAGRGAALFGSSAFAAVAWDLRAGACNCAAAVERERSMSGPPRLVWLDLAKEAKKALATLEGYSGQLSISPDGKLAAYFVDPQTLEIRDLADPERAARLTLVLSAYTWTPDGKRLLVKRGVTAPRKSGILEWVAVPPLEKVPAGKLPRAAIAETKEAFSGLSYQGFAVSPDGSYVALTRPGDLNLLIIPVQ